MLLIEILMIALFFFIYFNLFRTKKTIIISAVFFISYFILEYLLDPFVILNTFLVANPAILISIAMTYITYKCYLKVENRVL